MPHRFLFHLHIGPVTDSFRVSSVADMYRISSMATPVPLAAIVVIYPCGWQVTLTPDEALTNPLTVNVPDVHVYPVEREGDDPVQCWVVNTGRTTCTL